MVENERHNCLPELCFFQSVSNELEIVQVLFFEHVEIFQISAYTVDPQRTVDKDFCDPTVVIKKFFLVDSSNDKPLQQFHGQVSRNPSLFM